MLARFALWRAEHHSCTRINSAILLSSNEAFVSVYPNDAMYDDLIMKGNVTGEIVLSEMKTKSGLLHRFVRIGKSLFLICNAVPIDGHLIPSLLSAERISSKL